MLKKYLIILSLSLFLIPISEVRATSTPFLVTYFLNEVSSNITANPLVDPVKLNFVAEGNVENWVSVKIEKIDDSTIYKTYLPGLDCDNTDNCEKIWNGEISPSDKTLVDGVYKVIVHIKNVSDPIFDLTLTSPYTITVSTSTSTPDTTAPIITLLGDVAVNLTVGDTYTDAGATSTDSDLASSIVVVNPVDTSVAGDYVITYNVSDTAGNPAIEVTRNVTVSPVPVIIPVSDPVVSHSSSGSYV